MEKHSAVIEDQRNLTAELQMFKKKERMLKIVIAVMVLIIAFQVMCPSLNLGKQCLDSWCSPCVLDI
ncbi:hypothetical protein CASFOL_021560 [Castilleja foliolosa]|uniref:Uncharacterized protein n=1 Tax=Castilleja foliolosa TaxID=1961234 RepID=A0ABD3CWW8_9LAMI